MLVASVAEHSCKNQSVFIWVLFLVYSSKYRTTWVSNYEICILGHKDKKKNPGTILNHFLEYIIHTVEQKLQNKGHKMTNVKIKLGTNELLSWQTSFLPSFSLSLSSFFPSSLPSFLFKICYL